jgi:hypothetical protein
VRRNPALIDIAVALAIAAVVVAIEPGVAVAALLALLLLVVCGVSLVFDRRRARHAPAARSRRR